MLKPSEEQLLYSPTKCDIRLPSGYMLMVSREDAMLLPSDAQAPFLDPLLPTVRLAHTVIPAGMKQGRFANRVVLNPSIELGGYRFRAIIDWLEFEIHLGRGTQVQHVQNVLRRYLDRESFIAPMGKGPGEVFRACRIKVQEPRNFASVWAIHRALVDTFGEAAEARVTGLEVSVDAYPAVPSQSARMELLGAMQRTIWTDRDIWSNPDSRPRCAYGRGKGRTFKLSPSEDLDGTRGCRSQSEGHRMPLLDSTMYLGAKDDDVMIRLMHKVIDRQRPDGTSKVLAEEEKRVRVEVTLRGGELRALGVTDLLSLRDLKLTTMQGRYFQFRLPTFLSAHTCGSRFPAARHERETQRARAYLRAGVMSLTWMDKGIADNCFTIPPALLKTLRANNPTSGRARRQPIGPTLLAWSALCRKIHLALNDLQQREARAWRAIMS